MTKRSKEGSVDVKIPRMGKIKIDIGKLVTEVIGVVNSLTTEKEGIISKVRKELDAISKQEEPVKDPEAKDPLQSDK